METFTHTSIWHAWKYCPKTRVDSCGGVCAMTTMSLSRCTSCSISLCLYLAHTSHVVGHTRAASSRQKSYVGRGHGRQHDNSAETRFISVVSRRVHVSHAIALLAYGRTKYEPRKLHSSASLGVKLSSARPSPSASGSQNLCAMPRSTILWELSLATHHACPTNAKTREAQGAP